MWKAPGTQCALMAVFSDVSGRSETSLSSSAIDNPKNDEEQDRDWVKPSVTGYYDRPLRELTR